MMLDALVNTFGSVLPRLEAQLDTLESELLSGWDLVSFLGGVDRLPGMQAGSHRHFESHRAHVMALFDTANDCRDETSDAMEVFGSATSERHGEVINWLTMVTAVLLPLTFITGYFEMNFSVITKLHGTLASLLAIALPSALAIFQYCCCVFSLAASGFASSRHATHNPIPPYPSSSTTDSSYN